MPDWPTRGALADMVKPIGKKLNSLVGSAQRIARKKLSERKISLRTKDWQNEAWNFYDEVGELRFIVNTLANRLSQARLYVGVQNQESQTDAPEEIDDEAIVKLLTDFGGSHAGRAQIVHRLGVNLFIAGEAWLVDFPTNAIPAVGARVGVEITAGEEIPLVDQLLTEDQTEWRVFSVDEIETQIDGRVRIQTSETESIEIDPEENNLIRVWTPHPRRAWEADAATRASLPILRELVGLTMHIAAQIDSRLAGAGIFVIPQSAQRALQLAAGIEDEEGEDQFSEALLEHMTTPILDRGSASAVVPLVITVPDEVTEKFHHISFATEFDNESRALRDEAIRRLALGQDAPPEVLLGTSEMNHWGGWLVKEDVVSTHLEPPLALICNAMTTEYLWPALRESGMDEEEVRNHVIWYDVSHLVVRPNLATDAKLAHDAGVISDDALRTRLGFDAGDAPKHAPEDEPLPLEITIALDMVKADPALITTPGLLILVEQLRAVLTGTPIPPPEAPAIEAGPPGLGQPLGSPEDENTTTTTTEGAEPAAGGALPAQPAEPSIPGMEQ